MLVLVSKPLQSKAGVVPNTYSLALAVIVPPLTIQEIINRHYTVQQLNQVIQPSNMVPSNLPVALTRHEQV